MQQFVQKYIDEKLYSYYDIEKSNYSYINNAIC
jgi:hypothetical protein